MSLFLRRITHYSVENVYVKYNKTPVLIVNCKNSNFVPSYYDNEDPAPKFFSSQVQTLLKRLTRPDYSKVFRKRTSRGLTVLRTPVYKFLTDKELQECIQKANEKADELLQMPPVVKVQEPINEVLSKDVALVGYDKSAYVFIDISFGIPNEHRLIVQRDPDGTLRSCEHDVRKRLNQTYLPMKGRKIKEPLMFADEEKLMNLLHRREYQFVLDRACIQYEPDERTYQKVTSIAYQHLDSKSDYELLRSTRHFGPLVFYLSWHQSVDNLMLELIQNGAIREAVLLAAARHAIKGDVISGNVAADLTPQIIKTPVQQPESPTSEDIQLDTECIDYVEKYIKENSLMKSQHELALQGFKEEYERQIALTKGLLTAHGNA